MDNEHDVKLSYLLSLSRHSSSRNNFSNTRNYPRAMHAGIFSPPGKTRVPCVRSFDSLIPREKSDGEDSSKKRRARSRKIHAQTRNEEGTERRGWMGYTRRSPSISNPQWKRAREMVADIGRRYICEGAKGSALEHKKIGSPYSKRQPPTRHHPPPPPAFTTTLRFMEHSVHSIFSIVDRPYLSYLCFF